MILRSFHPFISGAMTTSSKLSLSKTYLPFARARKNSTCRRRRCLLEPSRKADEVRTDMFCLKAKSGRAGMSDSLGKGAENGTAVLRQNKKKIASWQPDPFFDFIMSGLVSCPTLHNVLPKANEYKWCIRREPFSRAVGRDSLRNVYCRGVLWYLASDLQYCAQIRI